MSGYTGSCKNNSADVTQRSSVGTSQCNPPELKVRLHQLTQNTYLGRLVYLEFESFGGRRAHRLSDRVAGGVLAALVQHAVVPEHHRPGWADALHRRGAPHDALDVSADLPPPRVLEVIRAV